jgi:hypothetical protein
LCGRTRAQPLRSRSSASRLDPRTVALRIPAAGADERMVRTEVRTPRVLTRRARASTRTVGELACILRTLVSRVRSRVRPVRTLVPPVRACVGGVRMLARSVRSSSRSVRKPIGRVRTQGSDASGRGPEALPAARMDALERRWRGGSNRNRIKKVREMGTPLGPPDFRLQARVSQAASGRVRCASGRERTRPIGERTHPERWFLSAASAFGVGVPPLPGAGRAMGEGVRG